MVKKFLNLFKKKRNESFERFKKSSVYSLYLLDKKNCGVVGGLQQLTELQKEILKSKKV
jgi:hypothetical protein